MHLFQAAVKKNNTLILSQVKTAKWTTCRHACMGSCRWTSCCFAGCLMHVTPERSICMIHDSWGKAVLRRNPFNCNNPTLFTCSSSGNDGLSGEIILSFHHTHTLVDNYQFNLAIDLHQIWLPTSSSSLLKTIGNTKYYLVNQREFWSSSSSEWNIRCRNLMGKSHQRTATNESNSVTPVQVLGRNSTHQPTSHQNS